MAQVQKDAYLDSFLADARERFGDNLQAVLIYGSYIEGYFDPAVSDYDVMLFFAQEPSPDHKTGLEQRFPRVTLMYYLTLDELDNRIQQGSWSLYIAILRGAVVLYQDEEFRRFTADLENLDMQKVLSDGKTVKKIREKFETEIQVQSEREGLEAIKWFVPTLRRMLQVLTYLETNKTVWGFEENMATNQNIFTDEQLNFIKDMQEKLMHRSDDFEEQDKQQAVRVLTKLSNIVLSKLVP